MPGATSVMLAMVPMASPATITGAPSRSAPTWANATSTRSPPPNDSRGQIASTNTTAAASATSTAVPTTSCARGQLATAAPAALARVRALLDDVDRQLARGQALLANTRGLLAILARGEGSLARLGSDPEFPEDAKELGRILKRTPWRIFGRTGRPDTHPDP